MIVVSAWHETRRSLLTIFVCPSPDCRPVYTQFSGCCGYTDLPFKAVACRFDLLFGWILAFSRHNYAPPIRTMTFVFSLSLIGGAYQTTARESDCRIRGLFVVSQLGVIYRDRKGSHQELLSLSRKRSASSQRMGLICLALPVSSFVATYVSVPNSIPLPML